MENKENKEKLIENLNKFFEREGHNGGSLEKSLEIFELISEELLPHVTGIMRSPIHVYEGQDVLAYTRSTIIKNAIDEFTAQYIMTELLRDIDGKLFFPYQIPIVVETEDGCYRVKFRYGLLNK